MTQKLILVLFAAVAALAAQARADDMSGAMTDSMSSNPDHAFAAVLISHARLERQIGDLVAQKATDPKIKQLAQEIATDHQRLSQRVQQAAEKAGITLHSDRMLPRDEAVLRHMQQLPVNTLERNYLFYEAGATQTNLLLSQWAARNAQKPEIKQAAQEVATKLEQRGKTINQMAEAEVGSSR